MEYSDQGPGGDPQKNKVTTTTTTTTTTTCSAFFWLKKKWFCKDKILLAAPPGPVLVSLNPAPAPVLCLRCARISSIRLFFSWWSKQIRVRTQTDPSFLFQGKQQYVAVCKTLAPQIRCVFTMNTLDSLDNFELRSFPDTPRTYPVLTYLQSEIYDNTLQCTTLPWRSITQNIPALCRITLHYTTLPYITIHYTTLHRITSHHYIASHHITPHTLYLVIRFQKLVAGQKVLCPPAELVQMPPLRRLRASPESTSSASIKALLHVKSIEILYPLIPNQSHVFISALSLASTSSSTTTARLTRSTTEFNVRSLVVNSSIVLADMLDRQTVSAFFI